MVSVGWGFFRVCSWLSRSGVSLNNVNMIPEQFGSKFPKLGQTFQNWVQLSKIGPTIQNCVQVSTVLGRVGLMWACRQNGSPVTSKSPRTSQTESRREWHCRKRILHFLNILPKWHLISPCEARGLGKAFINQYFACSRIWDWNRVQLDLLAANTRNYLLTNCEKYFWVVSSIASKSLHLLVVQFTGYFCLHWIVIKTDKPNRVWWSTQLVY